ncbi:ABC transporter ATP-binding protein [Litchfieldella anticariensis FP35 = DSM 16096]|uniref:Spermidine/putrescine import ATP-binding protein PotA n=1 Tax=Litchfieldella anticariensis (strain DSM 16096 / CECT 5854 / CIP 108499 / LMG 22089 / FP35) TaxID=1121939 RepID=S2L1E0_LITA3|nr:ABC transporter ATP-binding protein [Halomonas anticariensis]EPC01464.1 ABC transporter ATP-binding protein [Halomonas anticariensis FP35 = DSM 16096]
MSEYENVGVSIRSVSKRYGNTLALDDITLDIEPGEFVSLLGPSGSGKTTLLGALGGFVMPSSGSVWIGDQDVTYMPPHKRNIGVVFQSYALFPHMTVGENVAFPLRARRLPKSTWPERVRQALAMVELEGYQDRGISQLSGGQRQRVALARAMVFEPRLILMDEPLSALDKQLRETMQIELRQLHRKLGATIVYVTHDQREALTMSDRVAILKDGKLVQIGAPETLHNDPKDSFVASFIGDSTLLPVTRVDAHSVKLGKFTLHSARPVSTHPELLLAVQTEKLLIDDERHEAGVNRLNCRVREVVYQGDSLRLFLELEDGTHISLRQPSHHLGQQKIPPIGESLTVVLHPEDTIIVPRAGCQYPAANVA